MSKCLFSIAKILFMSTSDECIILPLSDLVPWRQIFQYAKLRWLPGAQDVCFQSASSSLFFYLGRVIPVVRGDGVYQPCMDFCVERLSKGEWVHLYPEGYVNTLHEVKRLKWGKYMF